MMKLTPEGQAWRSRALAAEDELKRLKADPSNRVWEMHPDDVQARKDGEIYGRKHAHQFAQERLPKLARLIEIYPDDRAHAALDELREEFWARVWMPTPAGGEEKA